MVEKPLAETQVRSSDLVIGQSFSGDNISKVSSIGASLAC